MAYTEAEARRLVVEAGRKLLEQGLVARTWGNVSARVSESCFIITPKASLSKTPAFVKRSNSTLFPLESYNLPFFFT